MRRQTAAILGYFGVESATSPFDEEIATALESAGVVVDPPLHGASRDAILELRLDRKGSRQAVADESGGTGDAAPPMHLLPDLVDRIAPAVVHVMAGDTQGSGFALDPDGFIITNAHVTAGAEEANVKFREGYSRPAKVKGVDLGTDLALLRVKEDELSTLSLRPLKSVRVGESVIAIGSPVGLEWSVSSGIVSGMNRSMPGPDGRHIDYMIQTDAEINPGNSGGPLITLDGQVIGVNSSGLIGQEVGGLNFAIPSDTVRMVYDEMREHGEVKRAVIGARVTSVSFFGKEADRWGQEGGAKVTKLVDEGPALRAGLQEGDIIVSFDGELIDEPGDVFRLLGRTRIGRDCAVRVLRDDAPLEAVIRPDSRP
jgi:S1-C subfamily serine protease